LAAFSLLAAADASATGVGFKMLKVALFVRDLL
jgi:hypothetical protein